VNGEEYRGMILSTVAVVARPEKRKEVERSFRALIGPTLAEPGCLDCHLYSEMYYSKHLILVTRWRDRADIERYIRSDKFRTILSLIDASSERPEVRFDHISETHGIDYIKAVRSAG
jgi:quinol monooxygenase YgiN